MMTAQEKLEQREEELKELDKVFDGYHWWRYYKDVKDNMFFHDELVKSLFNALVANYIVVFDDYQAELLVSSDPLAEKLWEAIFSKCNGAKTRYIVVEFHEDSKCGTASERYKLLKGWHRRENGIKWKDPVRLSSLDAFGSDYDVVISRSKHIVRVEVWKARK